MPRKLDDAFQATIERIGRQSSAKSTQAMEILKWAYLSKTQLAIIELRHVLATIHTTTDSLGLTALPFENSLIECCYGLIVIDRETSSVRLVHKSLQDFFDQKFNDMELFETGHCDVARTCLKYLSFNDYTMTSPVKMCSYEELRDRRTLTFRSIPF
jgi:hypothetical protein